MKRIITTLTVAAALTATMSAQQSDLAFRDNGEFKILQFTDMHLDAGSAYRRAQAEKTFARLSRNVRAEKPDFIAFTGDIVTGKPAAGMWSRLTDSLDVYGIPYCVVLGNHDAEQDLTRGQLADMAMASSYSLNAENAAGELADMEFSIRGSRGGDVAAALYFLDSHDYSTIDGIEGYGWFTPDQVSWLRERTAAMTGKNGGEPVPALAFFHIALKEYVPAWRNPENTHIGRAAEDECPGALNSGMLAAMAETGSVMGTFVGHDHDIDYIVAENGIAMGYGRFSGDDTTYNNLRPGVRVIVLKEGKRAFETWICEDDGRTVDHAVFENGKIKEL